MKIIKMFEYFRNKNGGNKCLVTLFFQTKLNDTQINLKSKLNNK